MKMFPIGDCDYQRPMIPTLYPPAGQKHMDLSMEDNMNYMAHVFTNARLFEPVQMPVPDQEFMKEFSHHRPYESSTAASKQSIFKEEQNTESENWKTKDIKSWTPSDVLDWITHVAEARQFAYESVNAPEFNVNGEDLLEFTPNDFRRRDPSYGHLLHDAFIKLKQEAPSRYHHNNFVPAESITKEIKNESTIAPCYLTLTKPSANHSTNYNAYSAEHVKNEITSSSDSYQFDLEHIEKEEPLDRRNDSSTNSSDSDSDSEMKEKKAKKNSGTGKRPPGRPPGVKSKKNKLEKKTGRLWEFIRDLLLNPQYCPSVICWENHDEGVFRFVKSDSVAKIWGSRKGNEKMTYEKLSRAMRYYYKSEVLQPVLGRRLVYKFGPTARGWRTSNPNFKDQEML